MLADIKEKLENHSPKTWKAIEYAVLYLIATPLIFLTIKTYNLNISELASHKDAILYKNIHTTGILSAIFYLCLANLISFIGKDNLFEKRHGDAERAFLIFFCYITSVPIFACYSGFAIIESCITNQEDFIFYKVTWIAGFSVTLLYIAANKFQYYSRHTYSYLYEVLTDTIGYAIALPLLIIGALGISDDLELKIIVSILYLSMILFFILNVYLSVASKKLEQHKHTNSN